MKNRKNEVAPCGIFCAACPSFNKSCFGCASEDKNQKRKSKWGCKIRKCCYTIKKLDYCADCEEFPCEIINKKLIKSHEGDARFRYRHELLEDVEIIKKHGLDQFIELKTKKYKCKYCSGCVWFYHYKCSECGKEN